MKATVYPGRLDGVIKAVGSKSDIHRLLTLSALCDKPTAIISASPSRDIDATANCLNALCAKVSRRGDDLFVAPGKAVEGAKLFVGDSGCTYRFLLPLTAALGVKADFVLGEGLKRRPVEPLIAQLASHGARIDRFKSLGGELSGGKYLLAGNISSQFISGLCMALPLLGADSVIVIDGELQSRGYVELTLEALDKFGIRERFENGSIYISGASRYISPAEIRAQGDWSSAAMLLCGAAASGDVRISGLDPLSAQPDRTVVDALKKMGADIFWEGGAIRSRKAKLSGSVIDVSGMPDAAPALAVAAIAAKGRTVLTGAARLRLKESDRIKTIVESLNAIGAEAFSKGNDIVINGTGRITGGRADSANDHRIAMMLACSAALASGPVEILGSQAVAKSYPSFYGDLRSLGLDIREETI